MATQEYSGAVKQSSNSGNDGIVTLSPNAETVTGTANNTAVTPLGLAAALGPRTLNGVLLGQGLGASQTATAAGSNGQVLIASSVGQPAFSSVTSSTLTITQGPNTLNLEAPSGGWLYATIDYGTITLPASTLLVGYAVSGPITFVLPTVAPLGSMYRILCGGISHSITLTQNSDQTIWFGSVNTTFGAGGSLAATNIGDALELVCVANPSQFFVVSSVGNWKVV